MVEKLFCLFNMRWAKPKGSRSGKNSRAGLFAEEITDRVAGDRGDEEEDNERRNREITLRSEKTGGEEETVAGQEEADEKTGLGENNSEEAKIAGSFNK